MQIETTKFFLLLLLLVAVVVIVVVVAVVIIMVLVVVVVVILLLNRYRRHGICIMCSPLSQDTYDILFRILPSKFRLITYLKFS